MPSDDHARLAELRAALAAVECRGRKAHDRLTDLGAALVVAGQQIAALEPRLKERQ